MNVEDLVVRPATPLTEAVRVLDEGTEGIVLVLDDDRRLVGIITDGDIRRAVLDEFDLTRPVEMLLERKAQGPYPSPVAAHEGDDRSQILQLMHDHRVRHVPVLDDAGRPIELVTQEKLLEEESEALAALGLDLTAVVMAGGQGQRLRPLTENVPKPMLPVAGRPLLEHIVDQLRESNVRSINISTNYLGEQIERHFADGSHHDVDINYIRETEPLGTAGALSLMDRPTSRFLVMNGDVLTRLDFTAMLRFHVEHEALLTVAIRRLEHEIPYGVVEVDGVEVTELREKPRMPYFVNAGIYLCEPEAWDRIPSRRFDMTDLIVELVARGERVVAFPVWEYWRDIGLHEDYERAREDYEGESTSP